MKECIGIESHDKYYIKNDERNWAPALTLQKLVKSFKFQIPFIFISAKRMLFYTYKHILAHMTQNKFIFLYIFCTILEDHGFRYKNLKCYALYFVRYDFQCYPKM